MESKPDQGKIEKDGPAGFLQTLETSLDDLRTLITCRVCVRPLFEPYTIECGHTFCYGCLARWFERDRAKKSCPDCRADVSRAPAPAYIVRDMIQIFAKRAELMPSGETTEEHRQWQEEEAALVEQDRSNNGPKGGLFRGCFKRKSVGGGFPAEYLAREPIRDMEDGVDRCPRCTWELEDGLCQSCGYPSGDDEFSDSDVPDYFPHDDVYSDDDEVDQLLDALGHGGHMHGFDREYSPASLYETGYSSNEESTVGDHPNNIPSNSGHQSTRRPRPRHDASTLDDSPEEDTDDYSEEDEEIGSLDGFIVDEAEDRVHSPSSPAHSHQWETDEGSQTEDVQTQISEDDSQGEHDNNSDEDDVPLDTNMTAESNLEDDSDEGPLPPPRRRTVMDRIQAPHNNTQGNANSTSLSRRYIPHHARSTRLNGDTSRGAPSEVESDSDIPVSASQRIQRRRVQRQVSPGNISDIDASSGTATVGRPSPRMPSRRQHAQSNTRNNGDSSPIELESSLERPNGDESQPPSNTRTLGSNENLVNRPGSSAPHRSHSHWNDPLTGLNSPPRLSPNAYVRNLGSPENSSNNNRSTNQSNSQRTHRNRRPSPLLRRAYLQSSSPGPSRPSTAEEEFQQGVRNRQARKAERKAERRRRKAERDRNRIEDAARSASPAR